MTLSKENATRLMWMNMAMILIVSIHDLDHIRQFYQFDVRVSLPVMLLNAFAFLPTLLALAFCTARSALAPLLTVNAGIAVMVAFSYVHLVGGIEFFEYFCQTYLEIGVDGFSWAIFGVNMLVSVVTIFKGWGIWVRQLDESPDLLKDDKNPLLD